MKQYKYLLFDADNTLFDFDRSEHEAFRLTALKLGLPYSEELSAKYHEINDGLWKALERGETTQSELRLERYRRLLKYLGEDGSRAAEANREYAARLGEMTFLLDGALDVIKKLSITYPLYLVTNGLSSVQHSRFASSPLAPYFRDIFVSEDIGITKPNRGYFDRVITEVGDPDRRNYLVIGDSLTSDIKGANNAELDSVWYNPDGKESIGAFPTYIITKLSELTGMLAFPENFG